MVHVAKFFVTLLIISLSFITFQSQAIAKDPDPKAEVAERYRSEGYEKQQKGNLEDALTAYTKALSLGIEDSGLYNDLGVIYEQLGVSGQAEQYYLKAIEIDSNYLPPYMNLAYIYKERGDTAEAIKYFEKRVFYGNPGDYWTQKARQELNQLDPTIEERRKKAEAKRLSREIIEKANNEFVASVVRSDQYYQAGQKFANQKLYNQAIVQYHQALLITPNNPKVLKARESALFNQAADEVRRRTGLALKYLDMGDTLSAREEYRRILTIIPKEAFHVSE